MLVQLQFWTHKDSTTNSMMQRFLFSKILAHSDHYARWPTHILHCRRASLLLTLTVGIQTPRAGTLGVFSAFHTAEENFYRVALIRPKGLFGRTLLSCSSMNGYKYLWGQKSISKSSGVASAYGLSNTLWDKLKPHCLQHINIGCAVFLNSVATESYKSWYAFTSVQQQCQGKLIVLT